MDPTTGTVEIVVVYNEQDTLDNVFLQSRGLAGARLVLLDNREHKRGLPEWFNAHKTTSTADWLIVCHQDFVVFDEDWLERVRALPPTACYGPIGLDASGTWRGRLRQTDGTMIGEPPGVDDVVALDEVCLIVPRSIYRLVDFDERFPFDFYVHDYCLEARRLGYRTRAVELDCQHRSKTLGGDVHSDRYRQALERFKGKYLDAGPLITSTFRMTPKYWNPVDQSPTLRAELDLIPAGSRVLEVGAAGGHMTQALSSQGCRVTAIEIDPGLAAHVRPFCEKLIIGDVQHLDLASALALASFDVILLGDVLEHLVNPALALRRFAPLLASEGSLVVSLPNVAHASIRHMLMAGRFDYQPQGLLDETHLRFFTLHSIVTLFNRTGYEIGDLRRTRVPMFGTEVAGDPVHAALSALRALCRDAEATTYQFVFRAVFRGGTVAQPLSALADPQWDAGAAMRELAAYYMLEGWSAAHRRNADPATARKLYLRAFVVRPGPRPLARIALSLLPHRLQRWMSPATAPTCPRC